MEKNDGVIKSPLITIRRIVDLGKRITGGCQNQCVEVWRTGYVCSLTISPQKKNTSYRGKNSDFIV